MSGERTNEHTEEHTEEHGEARTEGHEKAPLQEHPAGPGPGPGPGPAAATTATPTPPPSQTASPPPGRRKRSLALLAALATMAVICVVLIVLLGALWFQQRELQAELQQAGVDTAVALDRSLSTTDRLGQQFEALQDALREQQRLHDQMASRLNTLPERIADVETRVDAMQGGSMDARARWLRVEAEHYLSLASEELQLAGRWSNAVRALELADDRLRQLANPALGPVRDRIAADLVTLRGVERPDVDSIVRRIGGVAARADTLPLRSGPQRPQAQAAAAELNDLEPGVRRLWRSLQLALRGIVSVERRDEPVERTLTADERALVRRQLEVSLETARLAVLRESAASYQEALQAAIRVLEREYERGAAVDGTLATLRDLVAVDVAPARPDISEPLVMLRRLGGGER